jgi:hypothetical protein
MIETKESDQFPTDDFIMNLFEGWFDPCPLNDKPIIDGLKIEWKDKTYVNPPYSKPLPWVKKAIEEHKKGKRIVMLLKHDSSTEWFRLLHESKAQFLMFGSRLKHKTGKTSNFPSILVLLTEKELKDD